jgi:C4-type Zn-finger protein
LCMSEPHSGETCPFCKKGHFRIRPEAIAFHQWTDKGYVFCRLTVTLGICDNCGWRDWDESMEAMIDEAVRREYDKLP